MTTSASPTTPVTPGSSPSLGNLLAGLGSQQAAVGSQGVAPPAQPNQGIFDTLAGIGGHTVDRTTLNNYVANAQANNGLRSAQTELALVNAQKGVEEEQAADQLEGAFVGAGMKPSDAHLAAVSARMHAGSAENALNMFKAFQEGTKASATQTLGDVSQIGTPAQTAAQQALQGKVAEPVSVPNTYSILPGQPMPQVHSTAMGEAKLAETNALTGDDIARAEQSHATTKNLLAAGVNGGMTPEALHTAAAVVMADPSKMSQYSGFGPTGQIMKTAINNEIARQLNAANMTPEDMITQRAVGKASVSSAAQAAKQLQTLDAFTPLIQSNGNRIVQLLQQVSSDPASSNLPIVAGMERAAGRQLGSNDLAELHSVFGTYQNEVARLLAAGPSMNGVLSDKARGDVQAMAPENMTASQALRVINRINTEIGLRHQGVQGSLESAAHAQLETTAQPGAGSNAPNAAPAAAVPAGGTPSAAPAVSLDAYLKSHGY